MTRHLMGFTESQDSAVLVNVAALQDDVISAVGDDVTIPDDLTMAIWGYIVGPNVTRSVLVAPSIARRTAFELSPIDVAAIPASPPVLVDMRNNPLLLDADELLRAQASEDAAGASRSTIMLELADEVPAAIGGAEIRKVRFTSTDTAVANAWTSIGLTLTDNLEAGRYALVGAACRSANGQFARFIPRKGGYRPGFPMQQVIGDLQAEMFRNGGLGVWLEFEHNELPRLDVLCNAADAAFAGELDLVFLGRSGA